MLCFIYFQNRCKVDNGQFPRFWNQGKCVQIFSLCLMKNVRKLHYGKVSFKEYDLLISQSYSHNIFN